MLTLFLLFGVACCCSLFLTPICARIFKWLDIVDVPDSKRKLHSLPIPRAGGIPIVISYLVANGVVLFGLHYQQTLLRPHLSAFWLALPGVVLIFATGLIDDIAGLAPKQKLFLEVIAATWVCFAGVQITSVADHPVSAWWAIPLTIAWLVACTNAINLIDGLDGLASGVAVFVTLAALATALVQHNIGLALATAPLAGSLLGFLRYNFHPASVFLGDCGSLTVGFLLGCFAVIWCQKSATLLGMLAPLIALGLPLVDVGLAIGRRFLGNRPIFMADAGHIHHRLMARGLQPKQTTLILYAVCGSAALLSLVQSFLYQAVGGLVVIAFCCLVWLGVRALDYVEFRVAKQMVTTGEFRKILQEQICLQYLRHNLERATSIDDCWPVIRDSCRDLGFTFVRLQSSSKQFEEQLLNFANLPECRFVISLSEQCSLTLSCTYGNHKSLPIMSFIEILKMWISTCSVAAVDEKYPTPRILAENTIAHVTS